MDIIILIIAIKKNHINFVLKHRIQLSENL